MIAWILTAALLGIFGGTIVWFFKNTLKFFDWVVERLPGWFQALKVLIQRGAKVIYGTLTRDSNGTTQLYTPNNVTVEQVDVSKLDTSLQDALNRAPYMSNGGKMVEVKMESEAERELRRSA